jgi:hypothetical protein
LVFVRVARSSVWPSKWCPAACSAPLVERRRHDHGDVVRERERHGLLDVAVGGLATGGRQLADLQRFDAGGRHVHDGDFARCDLQRRGVVREAGADDRIGATQAVDVADDGGRGALFRRHVGERLDDDLGTDSGRVAHGDAEHGVGHRCMPLDVAR